MKKLGLALIFAALSVPALAENRVSLELLVGSADQELKPHAMAEKDGEGRKAGDDTSYGVRGVVGLSRHMAFEIAYQVYGTLDDSYIDSFGDTIGEEWSTDSVNLGVKGILPLNESFNLVGRVGVSMWGLEIRLTDSFYPGEVMGVNSSGNDIYYGVGAEYNLNPRTSIGLEYTYTEMATSFGGLAVDHEVENLSLFLGYKF